MLDNVPWIDPRQFGAQPSPFDSTQAFQRMFNALAANTPPTPNDITSVSARVHIPKGKWRITGPVTYLPTPALNAIRVCGDVSSGGTSDGSCLEFVPNAVTPYTAFTFGGWNTTLEDFNIISSATAPNNGHTGLKIQSSSLFRAKNINVYGTGPGPAGGPTTGLLVNNVGTAMLNDVNINGQTTAVVQTGGSPGMKVNGGLFAAIRGNGGACLQMFGAAGTLELTDVVSQDGDYGIQMKSDGVTSPEFLFVNNYQSNNAGIAGLDLVDGEEVYMEQFWATANVLGTANTNGIHAHAGFTGGVYAQNTIIGSVGGHGIWIEGGSGYQFIGGKMSRCGSNTANTFDDIHIAAAASIVTISGMHFDVGSLAGLSAPPARSPIFLEAGAGNVSVFGNHWKAAGYGTGTGVQGPGVPAVNVNNVAV